MPAGTPSFYVALSQIHYLFNRLLPTKEVASPRYIQYITVGCTKANSDDRSEYVISSSPVSARETTVQPCG